MAFAQADHPVFWEVTHHPVIWTVVVLGIGVLFAWLILGGVPEWQAGFDDPNFAP